MARYCFYCGRELQDKERCSCRDQRKGSSGFDPAFHGSDQSAHNGESGKKTGRSEPSEPFTSGNSGRQQKASGRPSSSNWRDKLKQTAAGFRQKSDGFLRSPRGRRPYKAAGGKRKFSFRSAALWGLRMMGAPRDFARDLMQKKRNSTLYAAIAAEAALMGLLAYFLARTSNFAAVIRFSLSVGNQTIRFWELFIAGVMFSLTFFFLKSLLFMLLARTGPRLRLTYKQAMYMQVPGTFYAIFFILMSMLATVGSGFQALALLLVSSVARAIIDLITWRDSTKITENQAIVLIVFTYLILLLIGGVVIDILFPGISRFAADGPAGAIGLIRNISL